MDIKKLQDLLKTEYGKPFKEFLYGYYLKLNSLTNIKDCSNAQDQALEVKSTKKAVLILEEMLGEIMTIEQFKKEKKSSEDSLLIP